MPEITYYVASSVDGYIATEDGAVDWLTSFQAQEEDHGFLELYSSVDALLMGSHTYEFALKAPKWPSPDKPSWIFSQRRLRRMHPSITLTADSPSKVVETLRERKIKHAWLMGGGKLATSFRTEGLISRYVITTIPVILGRGIPLFAPGGSQDSLALLTAKPFKSGIVQLTYKST
jgi:dihydrofolate reductase